MHEATRLDVLAEDRAPLLDEAHLGKRLRGRAGRPHHVVEEGQGDGGEGGGECGCLAAPAECTHLDGDLPELCYEQRDVGRYRVGFRLAPREKIAGLWDRAGESCAQDLWHVRREC